MAKSRQAVESGVFPTGAVPGSLGLLVDGDRHPPADVPLVPAVLCSHRRGVRDDALNSASSIPVVGVGDRGSETFLEFPLGADAGIETIKVNVASGNLFLRTRLMELAGSGVPASTYRVHNSLQAAPSGNSEVSFMDFDKTGLYAEAGGMSFFDGTGAKWTFTASGSSWVAPAGLRAGLAKNADGTWTLTYQDTGERIEFSRHGWMTKRADRNGVGTTYQWSGAATHPDSITDATGKRIELTHDSYGYLTSVSAAGRTTTVSRPANPNTRVMSIDYGAGRVATYTYQGERITSIGLAGKTVAFSYDAAGRVVQAKVSKSGEADRITSFDYSVAGTTKVTDANGGVTTYSIDSDKRVSAAVDQMGRRTSQTYDPKGNVETVTSSFSTTATTKTTYDSQNNATAITTPTGAATTAQYANSATCATAVS